MASASSAKAPASPPAPKGKDREVVNSIHQSTCAEKSHILPGEEGQRQHKKSKEIVIYG